MLVEQGFSSFLMIYQSTAVPCGTLKYHLKLQKINDEMPCSTLVQLISRKKTLISETQSITIHYII